MQKKVDCSGKISILLWVELETTGFKILSLPEPVSATGLNEMGI